MSRRYSGIHCAAQRAHKTRTRRGDSDKSSHHRVPPVPPIKTLDILCLLSARLVPRNNLTWHSAARHSSLQSSISSFLPITQPHYTLPSSNITTTRFSSITITTCHHQSIHRKLLPSAERLRPRRRPPGQLPDRGSTSPNVPHSSHTAHQ
jgi:hypothetical protein